MTENSPRVDLSRYTTGPDYAPGPLWRQAVWYLTSRLVFQTFLPWPSDWKAAVLRTFGATIGEGVVLKPQVRIKHPWFLVIGDHSWIGEDAWIDNVAPITIGSHVCLSQGTSLFTGNHDRTSPTFDLRLAPIEVEDGAWIGARAIVCPGARVKTHAMLNAGSVGKGELDAHGIYEGNPARRVGMREIRSRETS